jgi:hypothetical protein
MNWLTPAQWIIVGLWLLVMIVANSGLGPKLWAWLTTKRQTATANAAASVDEEALDLQAFHRLEARYKRLNCKEGMDAMKVAGTHFLHSGDAA